MHRKITKLSSCLLTYLFLAEATLVLCLKQELPEHWTSVFRQQGWVDGGKGIRRRRSLHHRQYYSLLTFHNQSLGCLHGTPWTVVSSSSCTRSTAELCELINRPFQITLANNHLYEGVGWHFRSSQSAVKWNFSWVCPLRWLLSWQLFGLYNIYATNGGII